MRADDLGSIYDKKTFTVTQMKFELFNTLPNRSLALLLAGPDLGDKIYKPGTMLCIKYKFFGVFSPKASF